MESGSSQSASTNTAKVGSKPTGVSVSVSVGVPSACTRAPRLVDAVHSLSLARTGSDPLSTATGSALDSGPQRPSKPAPITCTISSVRQVGALYGAPRSRRRSSRRERSAKCGFAGCSVRDGAFQTELDVVIDERRVPPLGGVQLGVGQGLAAAELLAGRVDAAGVEGLPVGKHSRGGGGVGEDHRAGRCPGAGGG